MLNILKQLCKSIAFFFLVVVKVLPQTNGKSLDLMCLPYCISSLNTNWNHHCLTAWMELHLLTCKIPLNLFQEGLIGNAIHQGELTLFSKLQKLHFVMRQSWGNLILLSGMAFFRQIPRIFLFLFQFALLVFPLEKHFSFSRAYPESNSLESSWFWQNRLFIAALTWSVLQAYFIFIIFLNYDSSHKIILRKHITLMSQAIINMDNGIFQCYYFTVSQCCVFQDLPWKFMIFLLLTYAPSSVLKFKSLRRQA